jgi:hypothetical protein
MHRRHGDGGGVWDDRGSWDDCSSRDDRVLRFQIHICLAVLIRH